MKSFEACSFNCIKVALWRIINDVHGISFNTCSCHNVKLHPFNYHLNLKFNTYFITIIHQHTKKATIFGGEGDQSDLLFNSSRELKGGNKLLSYYVAGKGGNKEPWLNSCYCCGFYCCCACPFYSCYACYLAQASSCAVRGADSAEDWLGPAPTGDWPLPTAPGAGATTEGPDEKSSLEKSLPARDGAFDNGPGF